MTFELDWIAQIFARNLALMVVVAGGLHLYFHKFKVQGDERKFDPRDLATPVVNQFLRFGASPRAAQTLVLAGKVRALLDGRGNVSIDDIRSVVLPAMRHRCLLNFEGEAEGKTTDEILQNIVETLPADVQMAGV